MPRYGRASLSFLLSVSLVLAARPAHAVAYRPQPLDPAPPGLARLAVGDGDRDAYDDIARFSPGVVDIHWNAGLPVPDMELITSLLAGNAVPSGIVFADMDADGRAEIATVGDAADAQLFVYRPIGFRTFAGDTYALPAGSPPGMRQVALADLDGDGLPELVVAERASLAVLHNRGGGLFDPPVDQGPVGTAVLRLLPGEYDGLAGEDVLVVRPDGFQLFANAGVAFVARPPFLTSQVESDVTALDLDGDGRLDLASTKGTSTYLYRNAGGGSFAAAGSIQAPAGSTWSSARDVNGDGRTDLLVLGSSGLMSVAYSDGALGFPVRNTRQIGSPAPMTAALGDLNADGDGGDLVYVESGVVNVLVSAGSASVPAPDSYPVAGRPIAAAAADLFATGSLAIAVASSGSDVVTVLANDGSGRYAVAAALPSLGSPFAVADVDFQGNGRPDLATLVIPAGVGGGSEAAQAGPAELLIYRNQGGGVFDPPARFAAGQGPTGLLSIDVDGDRRAELAVADGAAMAVLLFRWSPAGLVPTATIPLDFAPAALVKRDLDGDGDLDLAAAGTDLAGGRAAPLWNSGGVLRAGSSFSAGTGPVGLVALDLDGDGRAELAMVDRAREEILLFSAGGLTLFAPSGSLPLGAPPTAIAAGDFNCDSAEDLAVTLESVAADRLLIFLSEGNGPVASPQRFAAGMGPAGLLAGDLDRVGATDLALVAGDDDRLEVLLDRQCSDPGVCSGRPIDIFTAGTSCVGQATPAQASDSFTRYAWSTGDEGRQTVVPLPEPGGRRVSVLAIDEAGCAVRAEHVIAVEEGPLLSLSPSATVGCAGAGSEFTVELERADGDPAALEIGWSADSPANLEPGNPQRTSVIVRFPAGTAPGAYRVAAAASAETGCAASTEVALELRDDPVGPIEMRVTRGPLGSVQLEWDALVADVLRAADPTGLGGTPLALGVASGSYHDTPPPGLWYYAVRPVRACGTSGP